MRLTSVLVAACGNVVSCPHLFCRRTTSVRHAYAYGHRLAPRIRCVIGPPVGVAGQADASTRADAYTSACAHVTRLGSSRVCCLHWVNSDMFSPQSSETSARRGGWREQKCALAMDSSVMPPPVSTFTSALAVARTPSMMRGLQKHQRIVRQRCPDMGRHMTTGPTVKGVHYL